MKDPITYKIKDRVGKIGKSDWFPVSMITSETRAEEIKKKQKANMNIVRNKTKQNVNGKINFSSTPGGSQKDYADENTNSMFDENKILQDEENVQYNFRKTIVEKDEKKINTKTKKKKTSAFQTCKSNLEKKNLQLVNVQRIAFFELLHINCMAMSCNIRRLEKKLYRKLLKTQIDIETLLQEVSINTFQTYQQIGNGLIMQLCKQRQTPSG